VLIDRLEYVPTRSGIKIYPFSLSRVCKRVCAHARVNNVCQSVCHCLSVSHTRIDAQKRVWVKTSRDRRRLKINPKTLLLVYCHNYGTTTLKRLYVHCPICDLTFPSGFQAESPTQLLNFSYLCPKCRSIVPCAPAKYLEKAGNSFKVALRKEERFALYPPKSVALSGVFGKEFKLDKEVKIPHGVCMVSDGVFLRSEVEE